MNESAKLAQDPFATPQTLASVVNQSIEVNRLISVHPNASSELLDEIAEYWDDELEDYDDETRRRSLQHPNVSRDLILGWGHKFPSEVFKNPAASEWIKEIPPLYKEVPELLAAPECPLSWMRDVASAGTRYEKWTILRNPALPSEIRDLLSPTVFLDEAKQEITKLENETKDEQIKNFFRTYSEMALPYCMPRFLPFDRDNSNHRKNDQIARGFPFTCAAWPWPTDPSEGHLQPYLQLNLRQAGVHLQADLGSGLLQVWASPHFESEFQPVIRIIPESVLSDVPDTFYPEDAPWATEYDDCAFSPCPTSILPSPVVEWIPMGSMFLASKHAWVSRSVDVDALWNPIKELDLTEKVSKLLRKSEIPIWPATYFSSETSNVLRAYMYLGGVNSGDDWEAELFAWPGASKDGERLLFYVHEEFYSFGVKYLRQEEGQSVFDAFLLYHR